MTALSDAKRELDEELEKLSECLIFAERCDKEFDALIIEDSHLKERLRIARKNVSEAQTKRQFHDSMVESRLHGYVHALTMERKAMPASMSFDNKMNDEL